MHLHQYETIDTPSADVPCRWKQALEAAVTNPLGLTPSHSRARIATGSTAFTRTTVRTPLRGADVSIDALLRASH